MILPYYPLNRSNSCGSYFGLKMENGQSLNSDEAFDVLLPTDGTNPTHRVVNGTKRQKLSPTDTYLARQPSEVLVSPLSVDKGYDLLTSNLSFQGFPYGKKDSFDPNEFDTNVGTLTGIKPIMHNQYSLGSELEKISKHPKTAALDFDVENNQHSLLINSLKPSLPTYADKNILSAKTEPVVSESDITRPTKPTIGKQLDLRSSQLVPRANSPAVTQGTTTTATAVQPTFQTKSGNAKQRSSGAKKRRPSRQSHQSHFSSDFVYSLPLPLSSPQNLPTVLEIPEISAASAAAVEETPLELETSSVLSDASDYLNSKRANRLNPVKNTASKLKRLGYTSSEYNGVCYNKRKDKWRARFNFNGKREFLGDFDTEREAALAFDKRIKEVYPKGKQEERLNFIDGNRNPLTMKQ